MTRVATFRFQTPGGRACRTSTQSLSAAARIKSTPGMPKARANNYLTKAMQALIAAEAFHTHIDPTHRGGDPKIEGFFGGPRTHYPLQLGAELSAAHIEKDPDDDSDEYLDFDDYDEEEVDEDGEEEEE